MSEHLLTNNINRVLKREMQPAELLRADDHLAQCEACFKKIEELELAFGAPYFDFLNFSLEATKHLTYQQLENYLDEKSNDVECEIADVHLKVCENCRTELSGLIEMRKLIEADLQKQTLPGKPNEKSIFATMRNFFSNSNFFKYGFAAVTLLVFALAFFGF